MKRTVRSNGSRVKDAVALAKFYYHLSPVRGRLLFLRHRGLKPCDVFLASYPKSGNTWLRHLLTFVVTKQSTPWRGGLDGVSNLVGKHFELPLLAKGGGRLIKTHEAYREKYRRAVLLLRDGRDVAISEYFYQKAYAAHFSVYENSFEVFLRRFLEGKTNGYSSWHHHTMSWTDAAIKRPNQILAVPFDDLKSDTQLTLRKIVDFIGIEASNETIQSAVADTTVSAMKLKESEYWKSVGKPSPEFIRGGKSGTWRDHFTPELDDLYWSKAGTAMQRIGLRRDVNDPAGCDSECLAERGLQNG